MTQDITIKFPDQKFQVKFTIPSHLFSLFLHVMKHVKNGDYMTTLKSTFNSRTLESFVMEEQPLVIKPKKQTTFKKIIN